MPGWSTTPSDPDDPGTGGPVSPEDQRNAIELWRVASPEPYEGSQYAEINAYVFGFLYQDMVTTPGSTMTWSFAHRGRFGPDTIELRIGAPGATVTQTVETTDNSGWQVYSGSYTVPADQYITRFEFVAVASANGDSSTGNFLDAIQFNLDCDPEITKELTAVTPNGDGTYTATYEITVAGPEGAAKVYDLNDELQYGESVAVVGQPTVTAPPLVTPNPTFDGTSDTLVASGVTIPPAGVHTYTIDVVFSVDASTATFDDTGCAGGSGQPGDGLFSTRPR